LAREVERRSVLCDHCRHDATYLGEEKRIADLTRVYAREIWPVFAASMLASVSLGIEAVVRLLESESATTASVNERFETEVLPRLEACVRQDFELLHKMLGALDAPT
jgi:hypothetical protein